MLGVFVTPPRGHSFTVAHDVSDRIVQLAVWFRAKDPAFNAKISPLGQVGFWVHDTRVSNDKKNFA
jgi:hypothetical protein